ncbi:MAG: ribonuclease P protein component [Sinobacteraceae bacterium]|nr:ribonuclease P protein component [Nevskiaceae bacterium]
MGAGQRLPRRARMLKPAEFKQAFAEGARIVRPPLAVAYRRNPLGQPRIGLAIARKTVAKAVARNRIKRVIREEFRLHQERLPALDLVFYVPPGSARLDAASIRAALERIWSRLATA